MSTQITLTNFMKGRVKTSTLLNYVEQKLIEQGRKSMNEHGNCAYRGADGAKCGIGHIIPDSVYRNGMDDPDNDDNTIHAIVTDFRKHFKLEYTVMDHLKLGLLADIQDAHDSAYEHSKHCTFTDQIRKRFSQLREEYTYD